MKKSVKDFCRLNTFFATFSKCLRTHVGHMTKIEISPTY